MGNEWKRELNKVRRCSQSHRGIADTRQSAGLPVSVIYLVRYFRMKYEGPFYGIGSRWGRQIQRPSNQGVRQPEGNIFL